MVGLDLFQSLVFVPRFQDLQEPELYFLRQPLRSVHFNYYTVSPKFFSD